MWTPACGKVLEDLKVCDILLGITYMCYSPQELEIAGRKSYIYYSQYYVNASSKMKAHHARIA